MQTSAHAASCCFSSSTHMTHLLQLSEAHIQPPPPPLVNTHTHTPGRMKNNSISTQFEQHLNTEGQARDVNSLHLSRKHRPVWNGYKIIWMKNMFCKKIVSCEKPVHERLRANRRKARSSCLVWNKLVSWLRSKHQAWMPPRHELRNQERSSYHKIPPCIQLPATWGTVELMWCMWHVDENKTHTNRQETSGAVTM